MPALVHPSQHPRLFPVQTDVPGPHPHDLPWANTSPTLATRARRAAPTFAVSPSEQCLEGFELFGDPIFARAAHHLVGGDPTRIHGSIFDEDPEAIRRRVRETVAQHGPFRLDSDLMSGYGLALLRDGADETERTLWLYYGRNIGHGHADRLNLGLYAFGLDLPA